MHNWNPGDRVNWLKTERGGYGYISPTAAIVRRITAKAVTIEVARRARYPDPHWVRELRVVKAEKLSPRAELCEALGEKETANA